MNSNFELTLGYLNPALNNSAQQSNSKGRHTNDTRKRRYPSYDCFRSFLGSDPSSVWNFCTRFSDVILPGNQWWVASRNVGCFFKLRLPSQDVLPNANKKPTLAQTHIRQKLFNSLTFKDAVSGLEKLFSRSVLLPLSFFCHCISRNSPSVRSKKSET